jgi:radical SAM protein with 4Fe4S-binding SPASM domain
MTIRGRIKESQKNEEIPRGLYSYRGEDDFRNLALQLRIESSGDGLLVINANTVLYLNETAAAYSYYFMAGLSTEETVKAIRKMYRINAATAKEDYDRLVYNISTLAQTEEVCPLTFLDVDSVEPFSQNLSAPIRMDLALTFRCNNQCIHCYTGGPQETAELSTPVWKRIIDRLKDLGIFILTFTGGEPTLREDLAELLEYAQQKGFVTGLITNGRNLKDRIFVEELEKAGLDFVQITLESHIQEIHDSITGVEGSWKETVEAIQVVEATEIYLSTNTTLNTRNVETFLETVDFIHDLGVRAFGCNSLIYSGLAPSMAEDFAVSHDELKKLLPNIMERAETLNMKFNWFTPTQYCQLNPVQLGLGIKSCSACRINMCLGPEGDVYPCQSYMTSLGKILEDDWNSLWNHPLCLDIRERGYAPKKCSDCPELAICGAGCILELKARTDTLYSLKE